MRHTVSCGRRLGVSLLITVMDTDNSSPENTEKQLGETKCVHQEIETHMMALADLCMRSGEL